MAERAGLWLALEQRYVHRYSMPCTIQPTLERQAKGQIRTLVLLTTTPSCDQPGEASDPIDEEIKIDSWGGHMMRRLLILIAVIAIPLSLIAGPAVQAASAHVSTPASRSAGSSATVIVPATQPWTDTGISLSAGTVSFTASGTINVQSGNPPFTNTPAGQGPADPGCIGNADTPWGDDWTAEGLPCWSLIGRIGTARPLK